MELVKSRPDRLPLVRSVGESVRPEAQIAELPSNQVAWVCWKYAVIKISSPRRKTGQLTKMRVLQRIPLKRILSRQVSNRKQHRKQQMCFTQRGQPWQSLKTSFCHSLCLHHRLATTNSCNKGVVYARVTPTLKSEGWLSLKGWSQQRRTTIKTIDSDLGNGQIAGRVSGQRPIYAITPLWIQLQTIARQ